MSQRDAGSDAPENADDESTTDGRDEERSVSRRDFLTASAGASALYLGATGSAAGATTVAKTCTTMGELYVPDGDFKAINNEWSAPSADMCTYVYDDGSYGWEWDRGATGAGDPNYPQSLVGNKPWGTATGADGYPIRRKNVDTLEMTLDVDVTADESQGEWNLTEEWWLTNQKPALGKDTGSAITHEIMTVFEWSDAHDHGYPLEKGAFTDQYGNTFDYWEQYDIGWSFHIFRIQGNSAPSQVDFTPLMDYVGDNFGAGGDLWMTGMEVGNEYWDHTSGSTRIRQFDVTVNGTTHESGANVGRSDTTAPDAVSNLRCPGHDSSSVDLAWDASASGDVYEHRVLVDGSYDHSMSASATSTTVNSVSSGTCHDFAVQAIDGAGNVASASNVVSVDPGTGSCGSGSEPTEEDGSDSTSDGDSTAPTAPANLSAPDATESSADLDWDAAADDGGSGLDHYVVYVDGVSDHQVPAGTTSTTVDGLSTGASYDLAVSAVDGAGNESAKAGPVSVTTDEEETESSGSATGGLTLNDYGSESTWSGTNDLGKWEGSGSFESAGVQGEALRLEFSGGGWLQSYVSQDVSEYSQLKFRIRGDDGGEASAFAVTMGGGGGVLADLTDDSIGTTFSTVAVDMDAAGMDPTAPGKLHLDFWKGDYASGAIDVDRIWFE